MFILLSLIALAFAGLVNSDKSSIYLSSSSSNFILGGDLKVLVRWNGKWAAMVTSNGVKGVMDGFPDGSNGIISGGISDAGGVICTLSNSFQFSPTFSSSNPNGKWSKNGNGGICAMATDGEILRLNNGKMFIEQIGQSTSSYVDTKMKMVVSIGKKFLILNQTHVQILDPKLGLDNSKTFLHKMRVDERSRFSGNENGYIIKQDYQDSTLYQLSSDGLNLIVIKRLANPCGDDEVCQPFIASNQFIMTGIWGTYIGSLNGTARRLRVANASNGKAGVGIAVNEDNEFLYVGNDDADMGLISGVELTSPQINQEIRYKPVTVDVLSSPGVPSRWYIDYLGIPMANSLLLKQSVTKVFVGILDSGVLVTHPNLTLNHSLDIPNTIDDDSNGYVDDYVGYDFHLESGNVQDGFGHGTHVTGLVGTSSNAGIISIRALDQNGKSNSVGLLRGLEYAMALDVDVINCSWGGGSVTQALKNGFEKVIKMGIVVFSSAGNDGSSNDPPNVPEVPKCFEGVIAVGAVDQGGNVPKYSNYGSKSVMFLAPGDKIVSTTKDGQFGELSGTSMASPLAVSCFSTVLGILKSTFGGSKTRVELNKIAMDVMCKSAHPHPQSICGIINIEASVRLALEYKS